MTAGSAREPPVFGPARNRRFWAGGSGPENRPFFYMTRAGSGSVLLVNLNSRFRAGRKPALLLHDSGRFWFSTSIEPEPLVRTQNRRFTMQVGLEGSSIGHLWLDMIGKTLDEGSIFQCVGYRQLAGLLIMVVRNDIRSYVGDVDVASVPCGFGRAIGDKADVKKTLDTEGVEAANKLIYDGKEHRPSYLIGSLFRKKNP
ncbi:hypothetical protein OROMI_016932 [Orobanche minor]